MEFTIIDNNYAQSSIEQSRYVWKKLNKITLKRYLILVAVIVVLAIFRIFSYYNNHSKVSSLEIGLLIGALWAFFLTYQNARRGKSNYEKFDQVHAMLYKSGTNKHIISVNDDGVSSETDLISYHIKWKMFHEVELIDQFLFLKIKEDTLSGVIIDKSHLSFEEFQNLLAFAKSKVKRKVFINHSPPLPSISEK